MTTTSTRKRITRRGALIALAYVGIAAILPFSVLAFGSSIAVHRSATDEAEREALDSGELTAHIALGPLLTPALLNDEPAALRAFDQAARQYLDRGGAVHMKVWDAKGEIVYSDEPQLEGKRFALAPADRALLGTEKGTVGVSNLQLKENELERAQHSKLLEVYFGAHTTDGQPVLVESYYPYDLVTQRASELRDGFMPVMLMALAVLTLIQVPIAILLGLRVARYRRDRERLLERVIEVSDTERRRIAAEVHDGAVQDLLAVAYTVEGSAIEAEAPLDDTLREAASNTRRTIRRLRSLLSSIYPVEVPPGGLAEALAPLVADLEESGVDVEVILPSKRLSALDELLVLRAAREALRNVYSHAHATKVVVRVERRGGGLVLEVSDNGTGFTSEQALHQRQQGHLGLELLSDAAEDAGAGLEVSSQPGVGTVVRLELVSTS